MKVIIPENISEIKLWQFQEFSELLKDEKKSEEEIEEASFKIFLDIPKDKIKFIKEKDKTFLKKKIKVAIQKEVSFKKTFFLNKKEYGFIPNLDEITGWEFLDIKNYEKDVSTYHFLMAILFREIEKKDPFGNYIIKKYNGTKERAELFKEVPMNIVNGALGFFLTLSNDLQNFIARYITQQQVRGKKRLVFSQNGDGTQLLKT